MEGGCGGIGKARAVVIRRKGGFWERDVVAMPLVMVYRAGAR